MELFRRRFRRPIFRCLILGLILLWINTGGILPIMVSGGLDNPLQVVSVCGNSILLENGRQIELSELRYLPTNRILSQAFARGVSIQSFDPIKNRESVPCAFVTIRTTHPLIHWHFCPVDVSALAILVDPDCLSPSFEKVKTDNAERLTPGARPQFLRNRLSLQFDIGRLNALHFSIVEERLRQNFVPEEYLPTTGQSINVLNCGQ